MEEEEGRKDQSGLEAVPVKETLTSLKGSGSQA